MSTGKRYGLIIPKKPTNKKEVVCKPSIFGDDDEEDDPEALSKAVRKVGTGSSLNRKVKLEIDAALEENPDVYEYDAVYDQMQEERRAKFSGPAQPKEKDKKPKYINQLLKTASQRKREHERRVERQVQREREAEKDQFADTESFVTGAYRQKMAEIAAEEEEEKRKEMLEAKLDVTKQKDLSGFYRNLLRQTTGSDPEIPEIKQETAQQRVLEGKVDPEDSDATSSDSSLSERERSESRHDGRSKGNEQDNPRSWSRDKHRQCSREKGRRRSRSRSQGRRRSRSRSQGERRPRSQSRDRGRHNRNLADRTRDNKRQRSRSRSREYSHRRHDKAVGNTRQARSLDSSSAQGRHQYKPKTQNNEAQKPADEKATTKSTDSSATDQAAKFSKRNVGETVDDARARYLARKQGRVVVIARDPEEN